jgi:hypothetical protein
MDPVTNLSSPHSRPVLSLADLQAQLAATLGSPPERRTFLVDMNTLGSIVEWLDKHPTATGDDFRREFKQDKAAIIALDQY